VDKLKINYGVNHPAMQFGWCDHWIQAKRRVSEYMTALKQTISGGRPAKTG